MAGRFSTVPKRLPGRRKALPVFPVEVRTVPPENLSKNVRPGPVFRDTLRSRWKELPSPAERNAIMGYTFSTVAKGGPAVVEVPAEMATELETLFQFLIENPKQDGYAKFDTKAERDLFDKQVRSWASTRTVAGEEEGTTISEPIDYRQLRGTANLGETEVKFSLSYPLTEEEKAARKAANEAAAAKRQTSGPGKPGRPKGSANKAA